jgi:hypothetical protein
MEQSCARVCQEGADGRLKVQTMDLQTFNCLKRTFADLAIGDTFDFIRMAQPVMNSFYRRYVKISARRYQATTEPKTIYNIGSIHTCVYHLEEIDGF